MKLVLKIVLSKHRCHNSINLLKHDGNLICQNGFKLYFNKSNKDDITKMFEFSTFYGVKFLKQDGYWHYSDNVLTTPNKINFFVKNFDPLIFAETFLYDIHFTDFNLDGKVVIQAGGFTGDTALYYASRGAKVFSFEPDPFSFRQAIDNIGLNPKFSGNIVMKNFAVGNDGEIEFPLNKGGSGSSSAFSTKGGDTIKVKSVGIQTILNEFNIYDPYLLDLDIKGMEFDVLKNQDLSKFKIVRIEYSTFINNQKIGERADLLNKLKEQGFTKIRIFKHNELRYDLIEHGTIEATK